MADGAETELTLEDFAENFIRMSIDKTLDDINTTDNFDVSSLLGKI